MAVCPMNIQMLELCRRGKQNVGIVGCVCLEMFEDYCKEIFTFKTGKHSLLIRGNGCRVAVIDDQRANRRITARERFTQPAHIDYPWMTLNQVGAFQRRGVVFEKSAGTQ